MVITSGRTPRATRAALLALACLGLAGCGDGSSDARAATTSEPIRMVFFNSGSGHPYTAAMTVGAQARAAELGIELDVTDAAADPVQQVQQMRSSITSGRYVGGFVLPVAQNLLCDVSTEVAPANNFMLVVTNAPICDREQNEGEEAWAPGTLAFVSAGQEISNFTRWGEYIREANPGSQKLILVVGPETTGPSRNAEAALRRIGEKHSGFDVVGTVHTDLSQRDAVGKVQTALLAHGDVTIVASISSELTKAAVQILADQGRKNVLVYDFGAAASVLQMIERGDVAMTSPYYPRTMGATAVQALYDARVGRTPIPRFYAHGDQVPSALRGEEPLMFVTRKNLEAFRAAALSEY